jgi:hypothetical protein
MNFHRALTPIPSRLRGRGGAFYATLRGLPDGSSRHLPPPAVGEGWGGAATAQLNDRRAA